MSPHNDQIGAILMYNGFDFFNFPGPHDETDIEVTARVDSGEKSTGTRTLLMFILARGASLDRVIPILSYAWVAVPGP